MYSSYTAASFARERDLAEKYGVNLEGALTWAFEFEDQPFFAGFRSLASNGIDKPVLNVFRMFSRMGGRQLRVESDGSRSLDGSSVEGCERSPMYRPWRAATSAAPGSWSGTTTTMTCRGRKRRSNWYKPAEGSLSNDNRDTCRPDSGWSGCARGHDLAARRRGH